MVGRPAWYPDWSGEQVVLVGSGPSAKDVDLSLARGKARFIAINNSWQLAPWADILFAADYSWWLHYGGCPEFKGLKVSTGARFQFQEWGVRGLKTRRVDQLELYDLGTLGWGGGSGFQALNLAVQIGAPRVILVGFDMNIENGLHWHGPHEKGLANPRGNVPRWRRAMDGVDKQLARAGVEVLNCSLISSLKRYKVVPFRDLF